MPARVGQQFSTTPNVRISQFAANREVQIAAGAATRLLTPDEFRRAYPFYGVDGIVLGSINGFSGHGLQRSPAMGRGTAEWLTHGEYRTPDAPVVERAVI